ncbi:ALF repeat-containing protein, partial [Streptomyces sp. SID161]|uniref:ALF repeat-containing protein n=1 Tax=Streptomyces sp. SID161 TaxID=2690251 RepID=UPI0013FB1673|nr:hypothetical protein [Streptomyces sp. SID161]
MKQPSRSIRMGRGRAVRSGARASGIRAACATVLSAALTATLLGMAPANAVDTEPTANRGLVVGYWLSGGTGLQEAAEKALQGTDDDIRQFLTDAPGIEAVDDRVDVARVVNAGGPAVREAAMTALAGTPADVEAFLDEGWKAPNEQDLRVEATRVVNYGGPGVKDAGTKALLGTAADVKQFLDVDQYKAQQTDDRVEVTKLYNTGGANVKAAAKL